jgi:hypothetical protein
MKKIDIKGTEYVPVNERILEFWRVHPAWNIRTEIIESAPGTVRFQVSIVDDLGHLRATGHAEEKEGSSFINKLSYVENCETSAIGRALGVLGIGIDTSVASFEEVANQIANNPEPMTSGQAQMIENLIHTSTLQEEVLTNIERQYLTFSKPRADECIEYLKNNQKLSLDQQFKKIS